MNDSQEKQDLEDIADKLTSLSAAEREILLKSIIKKKRLLRMFVIILDAEADDKASAVFKEARLHFLFKLHGEGTANSELLDLLGLGSSSKIISICLATKPDVDDLMVRLTRDLRLRARGNGIAFSLTLSGSVAPIIKILGIEALDIIKKQLESEVEKMKSEALFELVLTVVNQGYSEDVMDAAKSAGATGGTVVHARQAYGEAAKVWGISLQGEREIVAILAKREQKIEIMKAINAKCGIKSEASGVTISLPVDSVAGLEE